MWLSPFISNPWLQDLVALPVTFVVALGFLKLNDWIARRGLLPEYITRKLVHIGTGPLFLLCWPLYSLTWHGRWVAALVPASLTGLFALIGVGIVRMGASVLPVFGITLLAALTEAYTPADFDNLSVPLVAAASFWLLNSWLHWWPVTPY